MVEDEAKPQKLRSKVVESDFSALAELFLPHIESFDHMVESGLETVINPTIHPPLKEANGMNKTLLPYECRQARISYTGKFTADVCFQYNEGAVIRESFNFGNFPVMLKSKICNLRNASPAKLVSYKEEQAEMGGYFICNGLERIVRLLIMLKRNHPMSMVRNSFRARREGYSDKAVVIRCVGEDQSSVTVKLYYLNNGSARLGFWIKGREFLLPVGAVLKALLDTTDHELYVALTCSYNEKYKGAKGAVGTQLVGERAKIILDELHNLSLLTRRQCLEHIGEHFQPVMEGMDKESYLVVGETVLNDYVFVHLGSNNHDKFNLLMLAATTLIPPSLFTSRPDISAGQSRFAAESRSSTSWPADIHLSKGIYLKVVTQYISITHIRGLDKLQEWLNRSKRLLNEEMKNKGEKFLLNNYRVFSVSFSVVTLPESDENAVTTIAVTDPLYCNPNDVGSTLKVTPILTGVENYIPWKRGMELALSTKRKLGFVTGAVGMPSRDTVRIEAWLAANSLVISLLFLGSCRMARKYKLNKDTYECKQNGKPVTEYYIQLRSLWDELENLNDYPVITVIAEEFSAFLDTMQRQKEEARLFQFLNSLDLSFGTQRSAILLMFPLPNVDDAMSIMVQEEAQQQNIQPAASCKT
ncbi:hypothetical protein KSS87_023267 [Heliosperma pusillum]|nr:hypothetical protein KSS87_023267 [Heliosperma pusillum]